MDDAFCKLTPSKFWIPHQLDGGIELEQVHQYLEDYERALQKFEAASIRDPGLHAEHEVSKLVNLLSKLEDLTVNKVSCLDSWLSMSILGP